MTEPTVVEYGDDVDTSESTKDRLKRYYNDMAIEQGYDSIEHFYVKQKFLLALKSTLSAGDNNMNNLLKTIAQDMGYTQVSREYVMENNLSNGSGNSLIGK